MTKKNIAKPILTVGLPKTSEARLISEIQSELDKKLYDYHVIVYTTDSDNFKFECFFEKDFNSVKYEELSNTIINVVK